MAVKILYGVLLGLSLLNMAAFVAFRSRQNNFYYGFMFLVGAISNSGYLLLSVSKGINEALLANKISYLGGIFLAPLILLCMLDLCNINIRWIGRLIIMLFSLFIYSLVLSTGFTNIYYSSAILEYDGYTRLVTTGGLFYPLFLAQTYVYMFLIIGIFIYSFRQKKSVSYKSMGYLLCITFMSVAVYASRKILHYDIDLVPLAYVLDGWMLLALQHRIAMYDVSSIVADVIFNEYNYGYMVFDKKKNYLASDEAAVKFFPQIQPLRVDFALPKDDPFFIKLRELMHQLDYTLNKAIDYIEFNGHEYELVVDYLKDGKGHQIGYYVEVSDATEERMNQRRMTEYNLRLKADVARETQHLRDVQDKMILGMATMIEDRDNSTGGHIKRTSTGVKILVKELMSRDEWDEIFTAPYCAAMIKAAPLHDIGKIAVDDDILKKPGRFTPAEFEQMKQHAPKGAELLHSVIADIEDPYFVKIAENMAHYHHERWNGSGYPDKLQGEQIPMEARVMAIADVYDALVSKRCYKDPMTYEQAANIIRDGMGTQFDPSLEEIFETCLPRLEKYYDAQLDLAEAAV